MPRYNNYANAATVNTTITTAASSATSPAAPNNASKTKRRHNSFTLAGQQHDQSRQHHHDLNLDRNHDHDSNQPDMTMYQDDDDNNDCNDLIPPRPPDVQTVHSNELPKRLTSYEMIPLIKPSSSMPNGLPTTRYSSVRDSNINDQENVLNSDEGLLLNDGGESQYHGSQPNIMITHPYRSHSRSTSKSYNVSNSNLTATTTLASSTLSNISSNSGAMGSGGGGGARRTPGGGYGLNSYGSNSNGNGSGSGPLGSRYNRTQIIEPRTTPYYYHELMQKSQVFDSNLNLLNDNQMETTTKQTPSRHAKETGMTATTPTASRRQSMGQYVSSLNGSLDNVLEATRRNLDDLILGNSLLYSAHSSNDLLNNNMNGGNSSSAATLVDDEQHHSLGYLGSNSITPPQNPIPAARNASLSNSSSTAYLKRNSLHSLHSSNSNILQNSNGNNSNNHHHMNHSNEKYVA